MSKFVFSDGFLSVAGVDLSDHVESMELEYSADAVESTAMGDTTHQNLGGLKNWGLSVTWRQDFAASEVDATLFDLVGTSVALVIRPASGAKSATNPEFTGNGLVTDYNPVGGSVGDIASAPTTFVPAGDLARATA